MAEHDQQFEESNEAQDYIKEEEVEPTTNSSNDQDESITVEEVNLENSQEIDQLKQEKDELEDKLLRIQAEFQNVQRRMKRDKEQTQKYRSQSLAKEILPALDNLERAMAIEVDTEPGENLKKGIELVITSLKEALEEEGIKEIAASGQAFDPNFHEAYTQVPAPEGIESGQVAQVFEKGYQIHDRVLRPAKVAVAE